MPLGTFAKLKTHKKQDKNDANCGLRRGEKRASSLPTLNPLQANI